jgi:hypothetical protein
MEEERMIEAVVSGVMQLLGVLSHFGFRVENTNVRVSSKQVHRKCCFVWNGWRRFSWRGVRCHRNNSFRTSWHSHACLSPLAWFVAFDLRDYFCVFPFLADEQAAHPMQ